MKKRVSLIGLILCVALLLSGCLARSDIESVTFSGRSVSPVYILKYKDFTISREEKYEGNTEEAMKYYDFIDDIATKGYIINTNYYRQYAKGDKVYRKVWGYSSDNEGISLYTLELTVVKCEETPIKIREKSDTFLITYYDCGYSNVERIYNKKKTLEECLEKNVVEVGKQDVQIRYKTDKN